MGRRLSWLTKAREAISLKFLRTSQLRFMPKSLVWFDFNTFDRESLVSEVGDLTASDVFLTPIRWLQRSMVEAPLVSLDEDGEPIEDSPLTALLEDPNPFYSDDVLMDGTVLSLAIDGNAYWLPAANGNGDIVELYWVPHTAVEPMTNDRGNPFITHYEYTAGGETTRLEVDELLHFRDGIDPQCPQKGLSPIRSILREIWTDKEAATFTAALLRNGGIPGIVVSPAESDYEISQEEGEAIEAKLEGKFTRTSRGKPIVMLGPTKIEQFGFSPQELDLSPLRDIAEERVTAAYGIPAAVVGFGTGLQSTKVGATMRELRQLAWWNGVIPMQRIIAGEITRQLASVYDVAEVIFDNEAVEALRENADSKARRMADLVRASIITRADARQELGYETTPADEVFLVPISTMEVPRTGAVMPSPQGNGNGNGNGEVDPAVRAAIEAAAKDHTPLEVAIADRAPKRKPPRQVARFIARMDRIRRDAPGILEAGLMRVFASLGEAADAVVLPVLQEFLPELEEAGAADEYETKQGAEHDAAIVDEIMSQIDIGSATASYQQELADGYLVLAQNVSADLAETFGIEFQLTEVAQQNVLRAAGRRAGLVDLEQQTRDALFDALAQGRAEGIANEALARRIRSHIEAGPWRDVATRARVIARTEGAFAANTATIESARSMPDTEHMMMSDNRTGFDDDICPQIDGSVVTIAEAEQLFADEHPNGTRSGTPINSLLLEELGL